MKKIGICMLGSMAVAGLTFGQPIESKPAVAAPRTAITCDWPVGPKDSAASLQRRFGRQARVQDIGIGEGETMRGIVLYPNDPRRRLEVLFWGTRMQGTQSVNFTGGQWTVAGIRIGDTLESVNQRNGRPMLMQQFGADYGGTVRGFESGALETGLGSCEPSIVFSTNSTELPDSLIGDGTVESDHADIPKARAYVGILGIEYPPPAGQ